MNKHQALNSFWSSFGLPAYNKTTVPPETKPPYITYENATGSIGDVINLTASLWYRDTGWEAISRKSQEIADYIDSMDPPTIAIDTGRLYLVRGNPWDQQMDDPNDDGIRRMVLNLQAEYLTQS